jgi:hypothetical protein
MTITRNRLYVFVLALCTAGYGWLAFHQLSDVSDSGMRFCFLKTATGFPCPACGTTRAVDSLLQGQVWEAIQWNPFGLPVAIIMVVVPLWIARDYVVKADSFFRFYQKAELKLSRTGIALPLIAMVLANWIWNYYKGY